MCMYVELLQTQLIIYTMLGRQRIHVSLVLGQSRRLVTRGESATRTEIESGSAGTWAFTIWPPPAVRECRGSLYSAFGLGERPQTAADFLPRRRAGEPQSISFGLASAPLPAVGCRTARGRRICLG